MFRNKHALCIVVTLQTVNRGDLAIYLAIIIIKTENEAVFQSTYMTISYI